MNQFTINQITVEGNDTIYLGFPSKNWQTLQPGSNSVSIPLPEETTAKVLRFTTNKAKPWQEMHFYQGSWYNNQTNKTVYTLTLTKVGSCATVNKDSDIANGKISFTLGSDPNGKVVMKGSYAVSS